MITEPSEQVEESW